MEIKDIPWLNEKIKEVPYKKKLYKIMKIILFKWKGFTYLEMYAILKELYKGKINDEKLCEKAALNEIMFIREYNNGIEN